MSEMEEEDITETQPQEEPEEPDVEQEINEQEEPTVKVVSQEKVMKLKTDTTVVPSLKLKFDYETTNALKTALKILKGETAEEVTFSYNGNLNIRQMNTSRTVLVTATIDMGAGIQNLVDPPKTTRVFTVDLASILKLLRDSSPTIEVNQAEVFVADDEYDHSSKISMPLLEDPDDGIPDPKVQLDIKTTLDLSKIFSKISKMAEEPKALKFTAANNQLTINGHNDLMQKIEITSKDKSCEGKGTATYSMEMLKPLGKDIWQITYANNSPMKATQTLTAVVGAGSKMIRKPIAVITVWLAPQLD